MKDDLELMQGLKEKATPEERELLEEVERLLEALKADVTDLRLKLMDAAETLRPFAEYSRQETGVLLLPPAVYKNAAKWLDILKDETRAKITYATMRKAVNVAERALAFNALAYMVQVHKVNDDEIKKRLDQEQIELGKDLQAWADHKERIGVTQGFAL